MRFQVLKVSCVYREKKVTKQLLLKENLRHHVFRNLYFWLSHLIDLCHLHKQLGAHTKQGVVHINFMYSVSNMRGDSLVAVTHISHEYLASVISVVGDSSDNSIMQMMMMHQKS